MRRDGGLEGVCRDEVTKPVAERKVAVDKKVPARWFWRGWPWTEP